MAAKDPKKPAGQKTATSGPTQKQIADALGLTTRQVHNLTDTGVLPRTVVNGKPVYDLGACVQAYIAHKAKEQDKAGSAREATALLNARKLQIEVERAELDLAKERGQSVTIDYMERQISGLLEALRAKALNFPGKYAPELVGLNEIAEVVTVLEDGIAELLTALSATGEDPSLDEDDDDDPSDDSAGE